jgi:hypothetical protein
MYTAMDLDKREMNRAALIADFGSTLGDEPEFRRHVEVVSRSIPARLAAAIHREGWIVEPTGGDEADRLARLYGQGPRRSRIVALFLREAAAALRFAPPEWTDPHEWAQVMMMNLGSVPVTPNGQGAGLSRRPSVPALASRERGCQAIAWRGACRCVVCGKPVERLPVRGDAISRTYQPFSCSPACEQDERYVTDAMNTVFERCAWLLDEAMTLRTELLPTY